MPLAVLLADDHDFVRRSIKSLLETDPEIRVVAEAVTLREAILKAAELKPDVVVLDLHMGDENQFEPAEVKVAFEPVRLIAVSIWDDDETKFLANSYGAAATVDKTNLSRALIAAVKQTSAE
jgi:two-component system response regulator DevR